MPLPNCSSVTEPLRAPRFATVNRSSPAGGGFQPEAHDDASNVIGAVIRAATRALRPSVAPVEPQPATTRAAPSAGPTARSPKFRQADTIGGIE